MRLLDDKDVAYYSIKGEHTRGGVGITVRTLKNVCFSNVSHEDIDRNIDLIVRAQCELDMREFVAWGNENCDCPTNSLAQTDRNKPARKRKTCWKCWQSLTE